MKRLLLGLCLLASSCQPASYTVDLPQEKHDDWILSEGPGAGADRKLPTAEARRAFREDDTPAAAVHVNPFYSIGAAVSESTRFVWHQATVMYAITRIGDYAPAPPARWYASVLIDLAAAVVACAACVAAGLRRTRRSW